MDYEAEDDEQTEEIDIFDDGLAMTNLYLK